MYTEQEGVVSYLKENRHNRDMDTTVMEAHLGDVHLSR